MAPGHIPAWKKLGLKLKNTQEPAEAQLEPKAPPDSSISTTGDKKRKQADIHKHDAIQLSTEREPKKAKKTVFENGYEGPAVNSSAQAQTPVAKRKRKSVSFAADVKDEDGGKSATELFEGDLPDAAISASPIASGNAKSELVAEAPEKLSSPSQPKQVKKKKIKKSKSTLLSEQPAAKSSEFEAPPNDHKPAPYLDYLTEYHTSRSTWKFNKTKQSQLFKHALDTSKIPSDHDPALYDYIMTLESVATASRLHEQAQKAIEDDEAFLANPTAAHAAPAKTILKLNPPKRKAEAPPPSPPEETPAQKRTREGYNAALARAKKQIHDGELAREEHELADDPVWQKRFFNRKRAEIILSATGKVKRKEDFIPKPAKVEVVEEKVPVTAANGGVTEVVKRRRKRKRRSGVPDHDSSSSESSSDSSSDESDNDGEDGARKAEAALAKAFGIGKAGEEAEAKAEAEDETSSSGGSDSDSGSEDSDSDSSTAESDSSD